jgi:hypothetical protein
MFTHHLFDSSGHPLESEQGQQTQFWKGTCKQTRGSQEPVIAHLDQSGFQ